eukprot:784861-Rhodomonas_salina.5
MMLQFKYWLWESLDPSRKTSGVRNSECDKALEKAQEACIRASSVVLAARQEKLQALGMHST